MAPSSGGGGGLDEVWDQTRLSFLSRQTDSLVSRQTDSRVSRQTDSLVSRQTDSRVSRQTDSLDSESHGSMLRTHMQSAKIRTPTHSCREWRCHLFRIGFEKIYSIIVV